MKIEVSRHDMLAAAKNASRVAPSGSPVEVLNGILVEGDEDSGVVFLTATNYEQSIQLKVKASVGESGSMLVNSRLLVGMMSLLPDEFVTLSATRQEVLKVTSGRCVYEINCLPSKSYPKPVMPFSEETVKLSGVCSLAKRTVFAVSKDEHKPALQCVNVKLRNNAVHATACDGMRMMLVKDNAGTPEQREFLLPGRALQMLASISTDADVFEVSEVGNEIVFMRDNMMFCMKKLPGEYIDTTTILKGIVLAYSAVTDANQMKEALGIISTGSDKEPVNISLSSGQIILRRNGDYSEARMTVTANVSKDTPDGGFYYNINALVKLFQVVDGRVKIELDAKGFMLIKSRTEVYLQLPIHAPVKKAAKPTAPKGKLKEQAAIIRLVDNI